MMKMNFKTVEMYGRLIAVRNSMENKEVVNGNF